jgi:hypothetical protein
MLNALRNDEHLAPRYLDRAVAKIDAQLAVDDDERFIGFLMVMPDQVALELHDLELIPVFTLPLSARRSLPRIDWMSGLAARR